MRYALRISALVTALAISSLVLTGCSTTEPAETPDTPAATETPKSADLDAAIATATTAVSDASTYIIGLKQSLPGATTNDDLEKLQTTLNLAATQTGAAQVATAQSALEQFNAGITKTEQSATTAPQDEGTQEQFRQLIATLEVGRDALDEALN